MKSGGIQNPSVRRHVVTQHLDAASFPGILNRAVRRPSANLVRINQPVRQEQRRGALRNSRCKHLVMMPLREYEGVIGSACQAVEDRIRPLSLVKKRADLAD